MTQERHLKAILDPLVFFIPPTPTKDSLADLLKAMDFVISALQHGLHVSVTKAVWQRINREFFQPAAYVLGSRHLATRMQILNSKLNFTAPPQGQGQTWGIKTLYTFANLPDSSFWLAEVANIAVHWINQGEEFVFLTRLSVGRNVKEHRLENCVIWEKTHWQIFVKSSVKNLAEVAIPCITSLRNLSVTWTQRYDDRLPDTAPTSGLAFVPALDWRKPSVCVVTTIQSKPTWEDAQKNGWSDTNTPGTGHHWDVFLRNNTLKKKFKDAHVNIKSWGTDDRGRVPGQVHH